MSGPTTNEWEWALRAAKFTGAAGVESGPMCSHPLKIIHKDPLDDDRRAKLALFDRGNRVYVVAFGPYVKIGFSTNVGRRMDALQEGCPETFSVMCFFPGERYDERHLFEKFRKYRLRGEWFSYEGKLKDWIDAGCDTAAVGLKKRLTFLSSKRYPRGL